MQCYISLNLVKKQTHLHLGWPEGCKSICSCKPHWSLCKQIVTGAGKPAVWRSRRGTERKDDRYTAGR
ncbi:hypothetical protein QQF64_001681 [Cirrhinus molitorella]|uniref:Uncharacterized protein n=1 Tax=Cirrhinus molitorella TaxID=172907 RepID=A0ABR3P1N9_9TELE